jgi:hypothetical protein
MWVPQADPLRPLSRVAGGNPDSAVSRFRYGNFFAPMRPVSQFDLRIERMAGEQIGAAGPAGLGNRRIDFVLRLGGGRSGGRGS